MTYHFISDENPTQKDRLLALLVFSAVSLFMFGIAFGIYVKNSNPEFSQTARASVAEVSVN